MQRVDFVRDDGVSREAQAALALPVVGTLLWVVPENGVLIGALAASVFFASWGGVYWLGRHLPRWARWLLGLAGCGIAVLIFLPGLMLPRGELTIEDCAKTSATLFISFCFWKVALWEVLPARLKRRPPCDE